MLTYLFWMLVRAMKGYTEKEDLNLKAFFNWLFGRKKNFVNTSSAMEVIDTGTYDEPGDTSAITEAFENAGQGIGDFLQAGSDPLNQSGAGSDPDGSGGQGVSNWFTELSDGIKSFFGSLFGKGDGSDSDVQNMLSGITTEDFEKLIADQREYGENQIASARDWQEKMANTAYQRTFADIEAAGYNPWIALQSGGVSPASIPSAESGANLGEVSMSDSMNNSMSNSNSAIMVALLAIIAKIAMKA